MKNKERFMVKPGNEAMKRLRLIVDSDKRKWQEIVRDIFLLGLDLYDNTQALKEQPTNADNQGV